MPSTQSVETTPMILIDYAECKEVGISTIHKCGTQSCTSSKMCEFRDHATQDLGSLRHEHDEFQWLNIEHLGSWRRTVGIRDRLSSSRSERCPITDIPDVVQVLRLCQEWPQHSLVPLDTSHISSNPVESRSNRPLSLHRAWSMLMS